MKRLTAALSTVMLVSAMSGCRSSDSGSTSTEDAFDFAEDDLCEWIGANIVSDIVTDAYRQHGASPIPAGFEQSWGSDPYLGCAWSAGDPGQVGSYSEVGLIRADLRSNDAERPFESHPALSPGVLVGPRAHHVGAPGDWVPGMEVRLLIEDQDYTVEFWHGVPRGFDGDANTILGIADGLLREMGWVPIPSN
jgi:hypothetical protein